MHNMISIKDRYLTREEENHKPGGKIIRGCGRGGISRSKSACISYILPSRIRQAFLGSSALQQTKLTISNLDYSITDSDMYEFFSRFGPLKYAKVQCNNLGKSLGYADVIFERRSDAVEAMKHCNGVALEGRKMNIQFSYGYRKPSLTINIKNRSSGLQKKNKRECHRRSKKTLRTNDNELDAQLEECMKSQLIISENF